MSLGTWRGGERAGPEKPSPRAISRTARWTGTLILLAGASSVALGLMVVLGWHTGNETMLQIRPGYIAMVYNAALCFVLCGAGLLSSSRWRTRLALPAGALVALAGILSVFQYVSGVDLGIDQVLMEHYITVETSHPGRMAPNTALCFLLGGSALVILGLPARAAWRPPAAGILGSMVGAVAVNALFGYLTGIRIAYGWGPLTPMAVHTAVGMVFVSAGVIACAWREGTPEGRCAPRWFPLLVGVAVLTATVGQWQASIVQDRTHMEQLIAREMTNLKTAIVSKLRYRIQTLERMAQRLVVRPDTPREEWEADTQRVLSHHAACRAVGWVDVAARLRWVVPLESYQAALGSDLAVEDRQREALEDSRRDRQPALTRGLDILSGERGFMAFVPIFSGDRFGGWISGAFHAQDLLDTLLDEDASLSDYAVRLDIGDDEDVQSSQSMGGEPEAGWVRTADVPLYGVDWKVKVWPRPEYLKEAASVLPRMILASGTLTAFLFALAVYLAQAAGRREREARAARQALEREAFERKRMGEALRENEARLQSILDNTTAVVSLKDLEGRFILVNRRFESLFHLSQEQVAGKTDLELFPPEAAEALRANDRKVLLAGAPLELEESVPLDEGTRTYLSIKFPLRDAQGKPYAICGISTDITERKRMEEALRESEERLGRIVETIADGIFMIGRDGRITFANPMAERIVGLTRSAITSRTHDDPAWKVCTVDGKPVPAEDFPFARVMTTGETVHGAELSVERPDGSRIAVSVNAAPLRDRAGNPIGVVASVTDITRRKEVERLKDEFVSTMSHELRTPLTSLRGFAELMLERSFTPEKQRQFLTIIRNEAVRLTTLINDFLDIQRMESGRQRYDFKSLGLRTLAQETLALFNREGGKHALILEVPDDLPPVWADADRIRQVLSNLVSNAIKFSPQGGQVAVRGRLEGGTVVLSVADQGLGISADTIPKLFGKFFRADNQETRSIGGTGLGLALVKEVVQAHGGRVWVESEPGKGSTFSFGLPVAQEPAPPVPAREPAAGRAPDVLLVEDDQAFARLLSEHFEAEGLSVAVTPRAEEALEMARLSSPRLLILDIHLAGDKDGWDVLVALKDDPIMKSIPVLIISVSDNINSRGLAVGGGDYLLKPISTEWLVQAVRGQLTTLGGKRLLVVDDDAEFRRQVKECFAVEEGVEVEEAVDGREAMARMRERMPDLLLLDLLMPEMDGFEVLRRLRADKRAVNLPVLVITGKDLSPEEKAYIKRGMATLVRKREASLEHIAQAAEHILAAPQT